LGASATAAAMTMSERDATTYKSFHAQPQVTARIAAAVLASHIAGSRAYITTSVAGHTMARESAFRAPALSVTSRRGHPPW